MKTLNYLVFLVFALTMSVSSCTKDESPSYEGLSPIEKKKELLSAKSWVKSYFLLNGDTIALAECDKGFVYTFLADRTVLYHQDANICTGETNGLGTWSMSGYGEILTIDDINWAIEITEDKLTLSMYHSEDDSLDETIFVPL